MRVRCPFRERLSQPSSLDYALGQGLRPIEKRRYISTYAEFGWRVTLPSAGATPAVGGAQGAQHGGRHRWRSRQPLRSRRWRGVRVPLAFVSRGGGWSRRGGRWGQEPRRRELRCSIHLATARGLGVAGPRRKSPGQPEHARESAEFSYVIVVFLDPRRDNEGGQPEEHHGRPGVEDGRDDRLRAFDRTYARVACRRPLYGDPRAARAHEHDRHHHPDSALHDLT
jgi:hypothetical protein